MDKSGRNTARVVSNWAVAVSAAAIRDVMSVSVLSEPWGSPGPFGGGGHGRSGGPCPGEEHFAELCFLEEAVAVREGERAPSVSGQLTLSQVAERLVMDRTTLTRNVAPLERDGLVKSERGPDRRERYLRLTAAGRRALAGALPLWRQAQAQAVKAIGPEAWRALRGGLQEFTTACTET